MLSLCTLFSGSSGNCVLISDGHTNLLVDCGVSGKRITAALEQLGVDPRSLDAVLVTHEHSDHTNSVGIMHRRFGIDIYANELTWRAVELVAGRYDERALHLFTGRFCIGDIEVQPFAIPHDAAQPVGYSFYAENKKITIATDIGHVSEELYDQIAGSDIALIEANHDVEMLKMGPYPYPLKRRILSDRGHLSNESAGELCARLAKGGTRKLLLGHLSQQNNLPEIAYQTVKNHLEQARAELGGDVSLEVAPRYTSSALCVAG